MSDPNYLINAAKLATVGGVVAVTGATEQTIAGDLNLRSALYSLEAVCTVAATTAGFWDLRAVPAGAVLVRLPLGAAAAVGTRIVWNFPVPWVALPTMQAFSLQPSVATLGTWQFIANGALVG